MQQHTQLKCSHCGNEDVEQMQYSTEQRSYVFRKLAQDQDGSIYVQAEVCDVVDAPVNTGASLYCVKCGEYFTDPGLPVD